MCTSQAFMEIAFEHASSGVPPPHSPAAARLAWLRVSAGTHRTAPSPPPQLIPDTPAPVISSTDCDLHAGRLALTHMQTYNQYKSYFNPHRGVDFAGRHLGFSLPQQTLLRRPTATPGLWRRGSHKAEQHPPPPPPYNRRRPYRSAAAGPRAHAPPLPPGWWRRCGGRAAGRWRRRRWVAAGPGGRCWSRRFCSSCCRWRAPPQPLPCL